MKIDVEKLKRELIDETKNKKIVGICTYSILALISLFMTLINVMTGKGLLTYATGVFSFLCFINLLFVVLGERTGIKTASLLFSIEVLVLFSYFLIFGTPEGFSPIWIIMLPSLGMLFFGRKKGSLLCGIMLLVLIFFLWTPGGNRLLRFEYSESFLMRFPILFTAFWLLAYFLEIVRVLTYKEMNQIRSEYQQLAIRDFLTGLYNRPGMYSELNSILLETHPEKMGVAIFDIDFFKDINDTYGHDAGDDVLKQFSKLIRDNLNALNCRWGGEEFTVMYFNGSLSVKDFDRFRQEIEQTRFKTREGEIKITVSIGICEDDPLEEDVDELIKYADEALYQAKNSGRNCVVVYEQKQSF